MDGEVFGLRMLRMVQSIFSFEREKQDRVMMTKIGNYKEKIQKLHEEHKKIFTTQTRVCL
jgi:hypothetical protein